MFVERRETTPSGSRSGDSSAGTSVSPQALRTLDDELARVSFRALGSRDADKLRYAADGLDAHTIRASVRAAADLFAHTLLVALGAESRSAEGQKYDARRKQDARRKSAKMEPKPAEVEGAMARVAGANVGRKDGAKGGDALMRRKSFTGLVSRRQSECTLGGRETPSSSSLSREIVQCFDDLNTISKSFVHLAVTQRTAVTDVCIDAMRGALPALQTISKQFSPGILAASKSARAAATRAASLIAEQERLAPATVEDHAAASALRLRGGELMILAEKVAAQAEEALAETSKAIEGIGTRVARGGFQAVFQYAKKDSRSNKDHGKSSVPSVSRPASLLNTVDCRSRELAAIVGAFESKVTTNVAEAKAASSARKIHAIEGAPTEKRMKRSKSVWQRRTGA